MRRFRFLAITVLAFVLLASSIMAVRFSPFDIPETCFTFGATAQAATSPGEAASGGAQAQPREYISQSARDTNLVIYQDLALVTEQRNLAVAQGPNLIRFRGIPGKIITDSVHPVSTDPSLLNFLEQSYANEAASKPELIWQATAKQAGSPVVELNYLTRGLSWKASYIAVLGSQGRTLDFAGWVTITNTSGGNFSLARVKLASERFMCDLPGRLTLRDGESKSILFVNASNIPVNKAYISEHSEEKPVTSSPVGVTTSQKVKVLMTFANTRDISQGLPLLAGDVRIYKAEPNSFKTLGGQDGLSYVPPNGPVQLHVGDDLDIIVDRSVTDYKEISPKLYETSYALRIRNRKPEDVELTLVEHFPGVWTMVASTSAGTWQKVDELTANCRVRVPANGTVDMLYRVKVSLP